MKWKRLSFLLVSLLIYRSLRADEGHHHEVTPEQLGSVSFATSCAPGVQKQFNVGIAWLYSFEYEQARKEFEGVAQADPGCAMAYWGQAMSLYHQLWSRPEKEDIHRGAELLKQGLALHPATQRELDYIDALALFYAGDDPAQYTKRQQEYSDAMDKLRLANPGDHEASVFYALSLLAMGDGKDPELKLQRKAVNVLNEQLREAPNHPGIMHYIIHATDNPQLAPLGLDAARAYARVAPASAHAVHMPSHIFARLGLWQEDINSNLAAIAVAQAMPAMHTAHHRLHSMDFLLSAYLQVGNDRAALEQVNGLKNLPKVDSMIPSYNDYYQAATIVFPAIYAVERRQWKDVLAIVPDPASPPYIQATACWFRAVAAGHLRDAAIAREAVEQLSRDIEETKKTSKAYVADDLLPKRDEALAWQRHAEGKDDEAVQLIQEVADKEDKVGKGETDIPAREMLADLLLEAGRPTEALREYELSLKANPNRFDSLYGAASASEATKRPEKAREYYAQLLKNCSGVESDRPELVRARAAMAESH